MQIGRRGAIGGLAAIFAAAAGKAGPFRIKRMKGKVGATAGKRKIGINLGGLAYFHAERPVNNLTYGMGPIYNFGGGAVVTDPQYLSPAGELLKMDPAFPLGYAGICLCPYPYAATKRLRMEAAPGTNFGLAPNAGIAAIAGTRTPASGFNADDGHCRTPGNIWFEQSFNWTADPGVPAATVLYWQITAMPAGGPGKVFIAEAQAGGLGYVSTDYWQPDYVAEISKYHTLRFLEPSAVLAFYDTTRPVTTSNRSRLGSFRPINFDTQAKLVLGTGTSQITFIAATYHRNYNHTGWNTGESPAWFPFGARGNDIIVEVVQGTGALSVAGDWATRKLTITLAVGGNTAAQVVAAFAAQNGNSDGFNMFGSVTATGGGTGNVAVTAPTNLTGGLNMVVQGLHGLEEMVDLCNQANANMHMTVQFNGNTAYYTWMANYIATHLNPGLSCYIEIGNENWNTGLGYSGSLWLAQEGRALNSFNQASYNDPGRWTMARLLELASTIMPIFTTAFTSAGRPNSLKRVIAWQLVNPLHLTWAFTQPVTTTLFDEIHVAMYIGANVDGYAWGVGQVVQQDECRYYGSTCYVALSSFTTASGEFPSVTPAKWRAVVVGRQAPPPMGATWANGDSYAKGQVVNYGGEVYVTLRTLIASSVTGQTPDVNTTDYALATAATLDYSIKRGNVQAMYFFAQNKAIADANGKEIHTYEAGYDTEPALARLQKSIQYDDGTYNTFKYCYTLFRDTYPASRYMHLGLFASAAESNFGLKEYINQSSTIAPRDRVLTDALAGVI